MVPEGFKESRLIELLDRVIDYRGISVPKASSGVPLITARNVKSGRLDFTEKEFIDVNDYESWMSRGTPTGEDILFTTEAPMGNVCRFPQEGLYAMGQRTVALRPNKTADSEFILQYFMSELGQRKLRKFSTGSTAKGIKSSELKKIRVLHPVSQVEQRKIGRILSAWDKAISATERLLTNAEQQKKALMQQLLTGKRRLPGFRKDWAVRPLGDHFRRVTRRNTTGDTNVVTISAQQGLIRQEEFFKKTIASDTLENYFLMKKGEFAYNKSYSNGYPMGAIKRLKRYDTGVVTSLYICFDVKDASRTSPCFFEHWFEAGLLNRGLTRVANEGGRAHGLLNVKPSDFFGLEVLTPDLDEQMAIANVLNLAQRDCELISSRLDFLKSEKKALMQQLLTGKRRVKIDIKPGKEASHG